MNEEKWSEFELFSHIRNDLTDTEINETVFLANITECQQIFLTPCVRKSHPKNYSDSYDLVDLPNKYVYLKKRIQKLRKYAEG